MRVRKGINALLEAGDCYSVNTRGKICAPRSRPVKGCDIRTDGHKDIFLIRYLINQDNFIPATRALEYYTLARGETNEILNSQNAMSLPLEAYSLKPSAFPAEGKKYFVQSKYWNVGVLQIVVSARRRMDLKPRPLVTLHVSCLREHIKLSGADFVIASVTMTFESPRSALGRRGRLEARQDEINRFWGDTA
ncbi:hypothetical protein EVAR_47917_1 [Eumeta japonica]|uniref:Uncharacterized protein n=1 Tax=Eumeta variegata TaxID=151549 RepID=A0A4C1Y6I6_EUMVA|nr:hypothetical protein EVAR_47917_1 [Eumeta japonica]